MLTRCLMRKPFAHLVRLVDLYLQVLQGKGAGSGWDLVSEAKVAARFLPEDDVVLFDIGANRGHWSQEIRSVRPGRRQRIFQFEPSVECQKILRTAADPDTLIVASAAGDYVGETSFFVPEPGSTISSVHRQRDSYFQEFSYTEEKVPITTVDRIVAEHSVEQIDFMKMDVEGNELAVLRGAQQSLSDGRIRALAFEFGSGQINARCYFHDFWDLLHPLGFSFLRICPGGILLPVEEYYEDLEYFRGATNYIAAGEKALAHLGAARG